MRHHAAAFGGATLVGVLAWCSLAYAQETARSYFDEPVRAPSDALELKLGTGYTQGFGYVAPGRGITDVAGAGFAASVDADYRLAIPWSIGVEAQYQEFASQQNTGARGAAFNAGATYHFQPTVRSDPWVRLGTGYRLLWETDPNGVQGSFLRHGFELGTAKAGWDLRVSEDIALAPVVGIDLNLFVWESQSNAASTALSSAQVGSFVYAGLQGRFDLAGTRGGVAATAQWQPPERPAVTAPQPESPIAPAVTVPETTPASPSLAVSEDVLRTCKLNLDAVDKAPKFDFDKSDLLPADVAVLKQIGECFTSGPLSGQNLRLVGRTDPRGSVSYNDALGMRRAKQVADYLQQRGVSAGRIEHVSRGKRDARGNDEASWAIDRRVDILEAP